MEGKVTFAPKLGGCREIAALPEAASQIASGHVTLGIELGSTRIKACLINRSGTVLATGSSQWQDHLVNGHWSYSLEAVWGGLQESITQLKTAVNESFGVPLESFENFGVSAMMHGYLAFDSNGEQLAEFRTWRDTTTEAAADKLTEAFGINVPMRWSASHYFQAVLDSESHVNDVDYLTTLAGYVHWKLTGEKTLGIGDASGMFPCDENTLDYDAKCLETFDSLLANNGIEKHFKDLLPVIKVAGTDAGRITADGIRLLDPTGQLQADSVCCPPEGDAGTGMVATNAVRPKTGNVSVGTSIFAMVVQDNRLQNLHREIDPVMTPSGAPVSMVHCNNGAAELSEWMGMFSEVAVAFGRQKIHDIDDVYSAIFTEALHGDADAGGVLVYNYRAGEPVSGLADGRPMLVRSSESKLSLSNVVRANLYSVFVTLALGMRTLEEEGVRVDFLQAHGGVFRTAAVAQRFLAAALNTPIKVAAQASEGGAWGIALLALYAGTDTEESLPDYLDNAVFASADVPAREPAADDVAGFRAYLERFEAGLNMQHVAVEVVPAQN